MLKKVQNAAREILSLCQKYIYSVDKQISIKLGMVSCFTRLLVLMHNILLTILIKWMVLVKSCGVFHLGPPDLLTIILYLSSYHWSLGSWPSITWSMGSLSLWLLVEIINETQLQDKIGVRVFIFPCACQVLVHMNLDVKWYNTHRSTSIS